MLEAKISDLEDIANETIQNETQRKDWSKHVNEMWCNLQVIEELENWWVGRHRKHILKNISHFCPHLIKL